MTPKEFRALTRPKLVKLARQGKLIDTAFKCFQRYVYPGAQPDQVAVMRTCFFAGAAELWAMQMAAADEGDDVTDGDEQFLADFVNEIERFHQRTLQTMTANPARQN
ncbi:MAG: hypothetical protein RIA08_09945 [Roseovarius sp.]|uniref:hypothetical protein n=1 Tax=Roseovarius sp. TaxID=1486281 RepID=UPI0032EAB8A8